MPHSPATQLATAPRPMPLLCVAARYRDTARRKFHRHSTDTHTPPRTRQRPVPRGPPPPTPQAPRTMPRTDEHSPRLRAHSVLNELTCPVMNHQQPAAHPRSSFAHARRELLLRSSRYGLQSVLNRDPRDMGLVLVVSVSSSTQHTGTPVDMRQLSVSSSNAVSRNPHATRSTHTTHLTCRSPCRTSRGVRHER